MSAARRYTKVQIFDALQSRIARDSAAEFVEALEQIAFITRLRARALVPAI